MSNKQKDRLEQWEKTEIKKIDTIDKKILLKILSDLEYNLRFVFSLPADTIEHIKLFNDYLEKINFSNLKIKYDKATIRTNNFEDYVLNFEEFLDDEVNDD